MNMLARFSPLVFALFVSEFSLGFPPVKADEFPKETNKSLTPEQARKLAKEFEGRGLFLDGLTTLDADTAEALAEFKGKMLYLNGLTTLDTAKAKALAKFEGDELSLHGLTTLDAATAKALAEFKGELTLPDTVLKQLFAKNPLTPETALAWSVVSKGNLSLDVLREHVTALDADTVKALAEFKGDLFLPDKVVKAFFAKNPLAPETAVAWATLSGGNLSHVTTLDAATSKALAEFKGSELYLTGLTTLDADTAKALAEFKGNWLDLSALTTLDAATAKAVAEFKGGNLILEGLTTVDTDTAKVLAAAWNWNGRLPGLTAFEAPDSIAVAQALAAREGRVALPNLKKVSPKTLTALIEKEDVEIPLIETLELIQEPDGSPNDDFVIPEWLEEREKERRAAQAAE